MTTRDIWRVRQVRQTKLERYTGLPLYEAFNERFHLHFRAADRRDAIWHLRETPAWTCGSNPKLAIREPGVNP
jgi:hypothetical protein